MRIRIDNSTEIDTDRDLSPAERHILQKLYGWKSLATSIEQFREQRERAMKLGWNNSGPIKETLALKRVADFLEQELRERLIKITKR